MQAVNGNQIGWPSVFVHVRRKCSMVTDQRQRNCRGGKDRGGLSGGSWTTTRPARGRGAQRRDRAPGALRRDRSHRRRLSSKWSALWGVADMGAVPTREDLGGRWRKRHGAELPARSFAPPRWQSAAWEDLGSNIAISLARAGVGQLILIDFDRVDRLQPEPPAVSGPTGGRATRRTALAENLRDIAPYTGA